MKNTNKVLILLVGVLIVFIFSFNNMLKIKNRTIDELEQENISLHTKIEFYEKANKEILDIISLSRIFVEAHINGNKEKLETLLSDQFTIEEKNGNLFIMYKYEDEDIEVCLYNKDSSYIYKNMILQGFNYDVENNTVNVNIREFYDAKNNDMSPPTFLNLSFRFIDETWKIVLLEFDI